MCLYLMLLAYKLLLELWVSVKIQVILWGEKVRKEKNETWNVEVKGLRATRCSNFPLWASSLFSFSPSSFPLLHATRSLPQPAELRYIHYCTVNSMWDITIATVLLWTKSWRLQSMSVTGMCLTQLLTKCFQNQIIKQYRNACLKRKTHARWFSQGPVLQGNKCV